MCKVTKDGYEMIDGTIIPFHNIDMKHIKPEHIMELNKSPASEWGILLMKNAMHTQRTDFGNLVNDMGTKFTDAIKDLNGKLDKHNEGTEGAIENKFKDMAEEFEKDGTVESERLNDRIDCRVKTTIKSSIISAGNVSKALIAIVVFLASIGGVVYWASILGSK